MQHKHLHGIARTQLRRCFIAAASQHRRCNKRRLLRRGGLEHQSCCNPDGAPFSAKILSSPPSSPVAQWCLFAAATLHVGYGVREGRKSGAGTTMAGHRARRQLQSPSSFCVAAPTRAVAAIVPLGSQQRCTVVGVLPLPEGRRKRFGRGKESKENEWRSTSAAEEIRLVAWRGKRWVRVARRTRLTMERN